MKIFGLAVLSFLFVGVCINADEIKPTNQWVGKSRDETHKDAGPENGMIVDGKAWTELWNKWHADDELPEIDFSKDLILVATVSGPNRMLIGKLQLENGELLFRTGATRMGGPGFGHLLVQIPREGIDSVNQVPVPVSEKVEDSILVDVFGTIRTGIMAIGGETTGTTITANNVTWELKLTEEQAKKAEVLNGTKVRVRGELNRQRGVEIGERWIVDVSTIGQEAGEPMGATDGFSFKTIVLETSGGFAGIRQTMTIHADGRVAGQNGSGEQKQTRWPGHKMAALHNHIAETDWSTVPKETRSKNVADDFQHDFTINRGKKTIRFTVDGTALPNVPSLERLVELIR